jgi:hypothetical protein
MLSPVGLSGQIVLRKSVTVGGPNQPHWEYGPGREKLLPSREKDAFGLA